MEIRKKWINKSFYKKFTINLKLAEEKKQLFLYFINWTLFCLMSLLRLFLGPISSLMFDNFYQSINICRMGHFRLFKSRGWLILNYLETHGCVHGQRAGHTPYNRPSTWVKQWRVREFLSWAKLNVFNVGTCKEVFIGCLYVLSGIYVGCL